MLTYELKKERGAPLYESLYRCIRGDILSGRLAAGTKLPSKRALAQNLKVSKITVESAYGQLVAEGYVRSVEKVGYFVEAVAPQPRREPVRQSPIPAAPEPILDLAANGSADFPFSVWMKLQRQVLLERGEQLLQPLHNQGAPELRRAIAGHLADFRGMQVDPENIVVGAGTDFLYNLLIQLLGRDRVYAVEEPGYGKIRKIYSAGGVECLGAPMDDKGVRPDALQNAGVLHISPSHHFPTGLVTPVSRRQELLRWARENDGYIIEDDYDSEFRFHTGPLSAMQAMDGSGRVIYLNSFSKTLAPSIRISYMVLPGPLMDAYREKLGFYSCTVPSFEQYTLAEFLDSGHFETHINRMRKFYRSRRNRVVSALEGCPWADRAMISEQDAGLHFLLRFSTELTDRELVDRFAAAGVRVRSLSSYYSEPFDGHTLVVNYSGLDENQLYRLENVRL